MSFYLWFKKNIRILDIGCGSGTWLALVAGFRSPSFIHGIDTHQATLNVAKHLLQKLSPRCAQQFSLESATTLPKEELSQYDLISIIDVLHHISVRQRTHFFDDLYKYMRPGAQLLLKDIDAQSPLVWANRLHDLVLGASMGHEMCLGQAINQVKGAGFSIEQIKQKRVLWYPHYTVLAKKPNKR